MKWDVYNTLLADSYIFEKAGNNIKFYEYPEVKDMKETHIVIDPITPGTPNDFADDIWLTNDYLFQIDVWSKTLEERDLIAKRIEKIMWEQLGFLPFGNGVDEWEKSYNIFRDARRYTGKKYNENIKE